MRVQSTSTQPGRLAAGAARAGTGALRGASFLVLALTASGCSSPASIDLNEVDTTRFVDLPANGAELGWGWNSYREAPVPGLCIEFVEGEEYGQTRYVSVHEVSDRHDVMQRLDLSAAASVQVAGFSGGAKAEFSKSVKVTGFSTSFVLEARVDNGVKFVAPAPTDARGRREALRAHYSPFSRRPALPQGTVRLTSHARALARKDRDTFRRECGDSFVSALYDGAQLYAFITYQKRSREAQQRVAAEVEASGWGVEAQASAASENQDVSESSDYTVRVFQAGGRGGELRYDQKGVAEMLRALPDSALEGPKFYRMAVTSYSQVPDWPGAPLETEESELLEVSSYWGSYSTLYDEIQYVLEEPQEFLLGSGITLEELERLQDDVLFTLRRLEAEARAGALVGEGWVFAQQRYSHPFDYRVRLPLPAEAMDETEESDGAEARLLEKQLQAAVAEALTPPYDARRWRESSRRIAVLQRRLQEVRGARPRALDPQALDEEGRRLLRRWIVDYYIRDLSNRRCQISKSAFGCLSNAEAGAYEALVPVGESVAAVRREVTIRPATDEGEAEDCLTVDEEGVLGLAGCSAAPVSEVVPVRRKKDGVAIRAGAACVEATASSAADLHMAPCAESALQSFAPQVSASLRQRLTLTPDRRLRWLDTCLGPSTATSEAVSVGPCAHPNTTPWSLTADGRLAVGERCLRFAGGELVLTGCSEEEEEQEEGVVGSWETRSSP